jgi:hypothetical protein
LSKLEWLLALRGDPAKGVPATAWTEVLETVDRDDILRAAIATVRELLLPDWVDRRKADTRPQKALEAAEAWLATRSAEATAQCKEAAKACTAARSETFGSDHRVVEAARAVAWAVTAKDNTTVIGVFPTVEEELLARIALLSEYHRGPEQRRALVGVVRRVLVPPEQNAATTEAAAAPKAPSADPVPYSPEGHFEVGQRIVHKKFGEVVACNVGETWVEVELPDGTKKRLAQKPR